MASNLSNELLNCIISFLKVKLSDTLSQAIDEGHQQGKSTKDILDEVLGGMITQAVRAPVSSPPSSGIVGTSAVVPAAGGVVTAAKKAPAKDVIINPETGLPRQCMATVQTSNTQCTHSAKHTEADGIFTCGVHHRSYASKKADPNKRPGAATPKMGASTFHSAVGMATSTAFQAFKPDDLIDIDGLPPISQ